MKKIELIILSLITVIFLSACTQKTTTLTLGSYFLDTDDFVSTSKIRLEEDSKFTFMLNFLSSYIPSGTYSISDGELILKTDDGEKEYFFQIDDKTLIFNEEKSTKTPAYKNATNLLVDGAEFNLGE